MQEMTRDQVRQVRRLLKALQKAVETVREMSREKISEKEKEKAIITLHQARLLLENSEQNRDDLQLGIFLIYLKGERYAEVKAVLHHHSLLHSLHAFGSVPSAMIQTVFTSAEVRCPLELSAFHSAYQEELQASP